MAETADAIRRKLIAAFAPRRLEIADESARHAGHSGARPGGESHFDLTVVSEAFVGLTRRQRQRRVYAALSQEMQGPIHALSIKALSPEEDAADVNRRPRSGGD